MKEVTISSTAWHELVASFLRDGVDYSVDHVGEKTRLTPLGVGVSFVCGEPIKIEVMIDGRKIAAMLAKPIDESIARTVATMRHGVE